LRPRYPVTKNEIKLKLFPKQAEFVKDKTENIALFAGRGSGKTRAGATKALMYALENPLSIGMIAAPSFPMLRDSSLVEFKAVCPPQLIRQFDKSNMVIKLENDSEILLRSLDDPEKAGRGPSLAWAWIDEAARAHYDAWRAVFAAVRHPEFKVQRWITTTPKGFNWCYQEFALNPRPDYKFYQCSSRDNIFLPEDYVKKLEEQYKSDPEYLLQEIEGGFTVVGGKSFFAKEVLIKMLAETIEPRESLEGCVEIWKTPIIGGKYTAGVDFAWGEQGSYAVCQILDFQTGEQVAKIRGRLPLDEMALQTHKLCDRYNRAYLGAECNGEGITGVNKLIELGYGSRMFHRAEDWYINEKKRGWHTNDTTRPIVLGELEEAVRNFAVRPYSKNTVSEMMSFIRDDKGKPAHAEGAYDDEVMSLAIAWHMRQVAHFEGKNVIKVGSY
jgi:hypothetical protein